MLTLARLVACGFNNPISEMMDTTKLDDLKKKLRSYSHPGSCQTPSACMKNACSVSALAARTCAFVTKRLFEETFQRIPRIRDRFVGNFFFFLRVLIKIFSGRRRWILRALLPWCGNIRFFRSSQLDSSERSSIETQSDECPIFLIDEFLSSAFIHFTLSVSDEEGGVASESEKFWRSLAFGGNQRNLVNVIEFLMRRMVTASRDVEYARKIVLNLFQLNPQMVLSSVIFPLERSRIFDILPSIGKENSEPSLNTTNPIDGGMLLRATLLVFRDCLAHEVGPCCPLLPLPLHYSLLLCSRKGGMDDLGSRIASQADIYSDMVLGVMESILYEIKGYGRSDQIIQSRFSKDEIEVRCKATKRIVGQVYIFPFGKYSYFFIL
jgi:hypothetical protein